MLVLSGCDGSPDPAPTTTAPLFATEAEAFAAAEATYRAYVDALNAVDLSDPATFEPVFALTTGEANKSERQTLSKMHADRWMVSGDSVISLLDPLTFRPETGSVELAICLDVSEVDVVGIDGKSVVDPDRVDVQVVEATAVPSSTSPTRMALASLEGRSGGPNC